MARLRRNIATAPVSKRKAARPAKAGGGPRLVGTEERLAKTLSDRGVPLAVARRIVSRMADAGDVVPARVADRLPVTTGYGTNWSYDIHKHDGGYVVTFQPRDLESRRTKGGHMGGYLSGTSISATPKTYRTKKAAFEAIAAHARRGQYLLYKNPPRYPRFKRADEYEDFQYDSESRDDATHARLGELRQRRASDRTTVAEEHELDRLEALLARYEEEQYDLQKYEESLARSNAKKNPFGGLVSCDGVVLRNPKRRRNNVAQERGLAKGQSLMQKAAAAFRLGKYPTMAEAMHGESDAGQAERERERSREMYYSMPRMNGRRR